MEKSSLNDARFQEHSLYSFLKCSMWNFWSQVRLMRFLSNV